MKNTIEKIMSCPVCGAALERKEKSLFCKGERTHCFDFASSGYVNLLPPGKGKNSKTGDDSSMISARKRFLSSGIYCGISSGVADIITEISKLSCKKDVSIVDAGCGEGWHTCNMIKTLDKSGMSGTVVGFDASKKGASAASQLAIRENIANPYFESDVNMGAFFAAGNIFSLPVKDSCVDFVTSLFAPIAWNENKRILKDDGAIIVCASGAHHLMELRELLYEDVRLSSGSVKCPDGFKEISSETVRYKALVENNRQLMDLFTMTPFYYRTSLSDKSKLEGVDELEITVEAQICAFSIID